MMKTVVAVFDQGNDGGQIFELVLVNLDDPQTVVVVLVEDGLDASRFSGAAVTIEQQIVRCFTCDEGLGIFNQHALLHLIADQIIESDIDSIGDRNQLGRAIVGLQAKGLVEA